MLNFLFRKKMLISRTHGYPTLYFIASPFNAKAGGQNIYGTIFKKCHLRVKKWH